MAVPLPCGVANLNASEIGTGPGGNTTPPIWTSTTFAPNASTIVQMIADCRTAGMTFSINLAGSRTGWCDPGPNGTLVYNPAKYEAKVRRWTIAGGASAAVVNAITKAFADKVAFAYVIDEPYHPDFNNTISPTAANKCGLLIKSIWPGVLTILRVDGSELNKWGKPVGGWTGFDYGFAQYVAHTDQGTPGQYFNTQRAALLQLDLGMIPGFNFVDGGIRSGSLDGVAACWPCGGANGIGGASGVRKGSVSGNAAPMTFYACNSSIPSGETRFFPAPNWVKRVADVIYNDADAPMFFGFAPWTLDSTRTAYLTLANSAGYAAAYDYMLNKFATRTAFNGLRTPKGTTAPPAKPVDTVTVTPATAALIVGNTVQLAAVLKDVNGGTLTGRTIIWTTSDASKATVSTLGLVTAVAAGTPTITATSETKTDTCVVTVTALPAIPSAPTLASPADAAVDQPTSLMLSWNAAAGATTYTIQISTSAVFTTFVSGPSADTSAYMSGLNIGTTYYWRVSAGNIAGFSAFSTARSFTTTAPVFGIQHIGSAGASGTSVSVPAHLTNDLLIFSATGFAGVAPTLPASKLSINAAAGGGLGIRGGYKVATGAGTTSDTWVGASSVTVDVYRGTHPTTPIVTRTATQALGNFVRYPTLTPSVRDNTSWIWAAGIHALATNVGTSPPAHMVKRNIADGGKSATFDSNGSAIVFLDARPIVNAIGQSRALICEIVADPAGAAPAVNSTPTLAPIVE